VQGFWAIFFFLVILKIPVFGALGLVWWAAQPNPDESYEPEAEESGEGFRRFRPEPKGPRRPRRGPHGGGAAKALPDCPPGGRTRVVRPAALPAYARGESHADRDGNPPRSCDA
jgi:hypothetical protein